MMWIMILIGLVGLIVGGEFLVRGSVALARRIGVSDLFIGAVLVGFASRLVMCSGLMWLTFFWCLASRQ